MSLSGSILKGRVGDKLMHLPLHHCYTDSHAPLTPVLSIADGLVFSSRESSVCLLSVDICKETRPQCTQSSSCLCLQFHCEPTTSANFDAITTPTRPRRQSQVSIINMNSTTDKDNILTKCKANVV